MLCFPPDNVQIDVRRLITHKHSGHQEITEILIFIINNYIGKHIRVLVRITMLALIFAFRFEFFDLGF